MVAVSGSGPAFHDPITFTLAAGGRTAHEVDKDCVNTLTLTSATASVLTFDEPQTGACQAGTVTFTRHGADLAYRWTDQPQLIQQTGTLHKTG
jgi:hypothetical protein